MTYCRVLRAFTCVVSLFIFVHSIIWSDFWVSPAHARYYGCLFSPPPNPEELVWLPYRTYCGRVQTMSSIPSWLIIDDYPEDDIPDCAELGSEQYRNNLEAQNEGCSVTAVSNVFVNVTSEYPLICNGNVTPTYWMSYFLERYSREFTSSL